jgi:hypothetical protein
LLAQSTWNFVHLAHNTLSTHKKTETVSLQPIPHYKWKKLQNSSTLQAERDARKIQICDG